MLFYSTWAQRVNSLRAIDLHRNDAKKKKKQTDFSSMKIPIVSLWSLFSIDMLSQPAPSSLLERMEVLPP